MKKDDRLWYYDTYCEAKSIEEELQKRLDTEEADDSWITAALALLIWACIALILLLTFNYI